MRNNQPVTQREISLAPQQKLISTTNDRGVITYCNDAFVEISGFDRADLIGAPQNIVRHPDVPPAVFAHMWGALKQGRPWMGIVKNRSRNGDHYWVNAYVTPIFEGSQVVGFESVRVKPTTDQIRRAESLYKRISQGKPAIPRQDAWQPALLDCLPYLTDNRSILIERPALRGLLPALSYPPCHAFVTPTKHNAVSQKDLAPSTESPAKCRFFCVPATCFSRSAHRTERRLNGQKDLTPYREPAMRGLFVVSHSRG